MKKPIMYHGSDLRIVSMSQEERIAYKNKCLILAEYLWPNFSECLQLGDYYRELNARVSNDVGLSYWNNFWYAINCFSGYKNNSESYQYDNDVIYLTNLKYRAEDYARKAFAGGESGMIAYRFQEMAAYIGFDLSTTPHNLQSALEEVRLMGDSTPKPVLFTIENYDIDKLKFENGKSVSEIILSSLDDNFGGSFRYYGKIDFDLASAILI